MRKAIEESIKKLQTKYKVMDYIESLNIETLLEDIKKAEEAEALYSRKGLTLYSIAWGDIEVFQSKKEKFKEAFITMIDTQLNVLEEIHQACSNIEEARSLFTEGITGEEIDIWKNLVLQTKAELNKKTIKQKLLNDIPLTDEEYHDLQRIIRGGNDKNENDENMG